MNTSKAEQELLSLDKELRNLSYISALMGWDQETYMPSEAVAGRGEQAALIEGMVHEKLTRAKTGDLISQVLNTENGDPMIHDLAKLLDRHHQRGVKIPGELVQEKARLVSLSQAAWAKARKENRFEDFAPYLEKMVDISRKTAELIGWEDHPYSALLEEFEPGMDTITLEKVFGEMEKSLSDMVKTIANQEGPNTKVLYRDYPESGQADLGRTIVGDLGFDWSRGRLDVTTHPFCTTLGFDDVRLTTRYERNFLPTAIYGIIHESGHGMYEQGFDPSLRGTSLAEGTSLGIHESQSRFWENMVGRSRAFVERYYPLMVRTFPHLEDQSSDKLYRALNSVQPSFIRVEADEVTYGLHIILRYRLEKALLEGSLDVGNLPSAWNNSFEELFGIKVPSDQEGVLQDIHWSMGAIGYFPTYALGNLYSGQFFSIMKGDFPDMDGMIRKGEYAPILDWLRQKIHHHGSRKTGAELIQEISSQSLSGKYYIDYLQEKYGQIYRL